MTEHHKIDTGDDMPKSMADKPVKYQLCVEHDGEPKDRYCFDHHAVICGVCVVRKHKNCKAEHVSEACKRFNISNDENAFYKDTSELLQYANSVKKSIADNVNNLEAQERDSLKDAQAHRDKLIKHINESYQILSVDVTDIVKEQKGKLSGNKSVVDKIIDDLISTLPKVHQSGAIKQNEQKRFLDLYAITENLSLLAVKMQSLGMTSVEMKHSFNMNIQPLVETNSKLGDMSVQESDAQLGTFPDIRHTYLSPCQDTDQTAEVSDRKYRGPSPLPVKLHVKLLTRSDKVNVKLDADEKDCNITGLDMTADGNIFLADFGNSKIKLFSPAGEYLSCLKLRDRPKDVSIMNMSEAAVSMTSKLISFIGMYDIRHLSLNRTINTESSVWGVTSLHNNLIITCGEAKDNPDKVQMIDIEGRVLWIVTRDTRGNNLFDVARFITTQSTEAGDNVVVIDWKKCTIAVLDAVSGNVSKVREVKGKEPRGVAVDGNGNIYVGYNNCEISMWSRDMGEDTCLVSGSVSVEYPVAMVYDRYRSELLLTSRSMGKQYCNFIHRYKLN